MEISNFSLDENNTVGCGCAACQSGQPDLVAYEQDNAEFQGNGDPLYAPSGNADPNEFANYLTHGYWQDRGASNRSWSQDTITFSLSNSYSASQQDGIRMALDLWSDVADIEFSEVASGANLSFVVGNDGRAFSSSYTSGTAITSSTISIDTSIGSWSDFDDLGNYALMTALHEVGHSLGLGHTGNYNGSASYNNDAQWTNDTHQTTVMSYFSDTNVGSDHRDSSNAYQYSATPMLIDILAIQNLYGADYTTRSGNTTYGFNSNAGHDQYDFSISEVPIAIWDGGGIDTIDASGYSTNQTIYLESGYFSSVGYMTNNLVIAYGAEIENAIGGTGDDTIYGNDSDNIILGGAGADTLYGSDGSDTLNGEDGSDSVTYVYSVSDFVYNFINNTTVALTHILNNFTDTISNIEDFIFFDGNYTFDELETAFGDLENMSVKLFWGGGNYLENIREEGDITLSANDIGYGGSTGNQILISRDFYDTTVTVLDANAPNTIRLNGTTNSDTLTVNGTHNTMSVKVYAGSGDDTVSIQIVGNDQIFGEDGDDVISTGDGHDKIFGGNGNDTLNGENGNDRLIGGLGNDILNGGDGNDRLDANEGDDTLNGGAGVDKLFGYDGVDILNGGADNDRLYGMNDDDVLNGDGGNDNLLGGDGNDELNGGLGRDRLQGEEGNDLLNGDDGNDKLYGQNGNDTLNGGAGKDYLYGGAGIDTLNGDDGNDLLYGQDGDDILDGGIGHDKLYGDANNDTLNGNDGIDRLEGGTGNDTLNGGNDDDTLYGEDGADRLNGDAGDDTLIGGNNDDTLVGGLGLDSLTGGSGNDTFGFTALDGNADQINDFSLLGADIDFLNITDVLTGFDPATDDINDFVIMNFKNTDRTDLFINSDGVGSDWDQTAIIRGSDFTGITVNDMLNAGRLITDDTLL